MSTFLRHLSWIWVLAVFSMPAAATVKLKTLDDGSVVMYNERSSTRTVKPRPQRRQSNVSRADLEEAIRQHARAQRLDPELVKAVIQVESGFYPLAQSHKGAMGLMQLMPATARDLAVRDPWDPNENLRGGTIYLRHMLDLFGGQLELALAGYNAGPENVERYGGIPPFEETRSYVEKVLRIYRGDSNYSVGSSPLVRRGRKAYLRRNEDGSYLLTTSKSIDR